MCLHLVYCLTESKCFMLGGREFLLRTATGSKNLLYQPLTDIHSGVIQDQKMVSIIWHQ